MIAWEAFLFCSKWKLPVPEWILEYLKKTGENLLELSGKMTFEKLQTALGLWTSGKGNIFSRYEDSKLKVLVVCKVLEYKKANPKEPFLAIYARVAQELREETQKPISEETIRDWHQELKDLLD